MSIKFYSYILLFALNVSFNSLQSQNIVDSLVKQLEKTTNDSAKARLMNQLSWNLLGKNPDKALNYAQKALAIAERNNYKHEEANSHNYIGNYYLDMGNYSFALRNFLKSLRIEEELDNKQGIAYLYGNIGIIYYYQKNYSKVLDYFFKSLHIKELMNDKKGMAHSYNNIGVIYKDQSDYEMAKKFYSMSLNIKIELEDKKGIANSYVNIGEIYSLQQLFKEALEYHQKALEIQQEIGDKLGITFTLSGIAGIHNKSGNSQLAVNYIKKSIDIASELNAKNVLKDNYLLMAETLEKLTDYKQAYKYHKLYAATNDSLYNEKSSKAINETQAKYETKEKEKEIELLRKNERIKTLELKTSENLKIFFSSLSALIIILALVIYNRYRLKQKINDELVFINRKLLESEKNLREVNATKDKFFTIMAHDLKNPFSTLQSLADFLNESYYELKDTDRVKIIKTLKDSTNLTHELFENLMQWALAQTGKIHYKADIVDLCAAVKINLALLRADAMKKNIMLTSEIKGNTFVNADADMVKTILRNLISNAIKFTNEGGWIKVKSEKKNDFEEISIIDNGIGLNEKDQRRILSKEKGTGLGLILCKEFVEMNGGKISVDSGLGRGSTFKFTLQTHLSDD